MGQGKGRTHGDETWGGEHTIQHIDDVLENCTSETCNFINLYYTSKKFMEKIKR